MEEFTRHSVKQYHQGKISPKRNHFYQSVKSKTGIEMLKLKYVIYMFFIFTLTANAKGNLYDVDIIGKTTCIFSNGVPDHKIGNVLIKLTQIS